MCTHDVSSFLTPDVCNKQRDISRSGNADWNLKKKKKSCSSLVIPAGQAAAYIWIQTFQYAVLGNIQCLELCFRVSGGVSLAVMTATAKDRPDYL